MGDLGDLEFPIPFQRNRALAPNSNHPFTWLDDRRTKGSNGAHSEYKVSASSAPIVLPMALESNAADGEPSKIHIVIGNINGPSLYQGRKERRKLIIANILEGQNYQPDFLAFQDGVLPIDVREFIAALNETTSGVTKYSDIPETAKRPSASSEKVNAYKTNREALLYATLWERLYEEEDLFYTPFTSKRLLWDRCRFGIFKKSGSAMKMVVVCYHGRTKQIKDSK